MGFELIATSNDEGTSMLRELLCSCLGVVCIAGVTACGVGAIEGPDEDKIKASLRGVAYGEYFLGTTDYIWKTEIKSLEITSRQKTEDGVEYIVKAKLQGTTNGGRCSIGTEKTCPATLNVSYRKVGEEWVLKHSKPVGQFSYVQ